MSETPALPTSDERIMAALSHFFGPIVSLIVWATQKDKSSFVRFQSLQALAFDLILLVLNLAAVACLAAVAFGAVVLVFAAASRDSSQTARWVFVAMMAPFLFWVPLLPCTLGSTAIRLWATWQVLQGRNFRYPWLADKIEQFSTNK
jgi:uncharacterized Tic20 family protein